MAEQAKEVQKLHTKRRTRVEKFRQEVGLSLTQSSSRNPLEQPWALTPEEYARKAKGYPLRLYTAARDETMALAEAIEKVEKEIDERVAALYGL
jgi:predicted transcriptional regulator